jgi:hypothetical protein
MNITEFAQAASALAAIAMILIGSRWLKQHLRNLFTCCSISFGE